MNFMLSTNQVKKIASMFEGYAVEVNSNCAHAYFDKPEYTHEAETILEMAGYQCYPCGCELRVEW